jgi:hypothetical protein
MKVIGMSDDVNTCDCCGKTDLKRTVVLQDNETGETFHYGTTCATKRSNGCINAEERKNKIKKAIIHAEYISSSRYRKDLKLEIERLTSIKRYSTYIAEEIEEVARVYVSLRHKGLNKISFSSYEEQIVAREERRLEIYEMAIA